MAEYNYPLSPSSISMFIECAHRFYLRYIRRMKLTAGISADFGTVIHKINENFWGEYYKVGNIETALQSSIDNTWDSKLDDEYSVVGKQCLDNFKRSLETTFTIPLYTELKIDNPENNTVCIIDIVYPSRIVDYKTSTQFTVKPKINNIIQAVLCSDNLKQAMDLDIPTVDFHYLRFNKYQHVIVNDELRETVNNIIVDMRKDIHDDNFPKNKKSCFFCDYRLLCQMEDKAIDKYKRKTEMKSCSKKVLLSE